MCCEFEADQKVLQLKKDGWVNALKGLEEKVVVARQTYQKSLKRVMEYVYWVRDKILEQMRGFFS